MTVSVKVSEDVYLKLKWLKNRYQAIKEKDLTWDEFIKSVIEDNLLLLAYYFKRKVPDMSVESAQAFLFGSYFSLDEIVDDDRKMLMEQLNSRKGD